MWCSGLRKGKYGRSGEHIGALTEIKEQVMSALEKEDCYG